MQTRLRKACHLDKPEHVHRPHQHCHLTADHTGQDGLNQALCCSGVP